MRHFYALTCAIALCTSFLPRCHGETFDGYTLQEAYFALSDSTIIDLYQGETGPLGEANMLTPTLEAKCLDFINKAINTPSGTTPYWITYEQLNNTETQRIRGPDGPVYIVVLDLFCVHLTPTNVIIKDYTSEFIADLKATKQDALSQLPAKKKAFEAYVQKTGGVRSGNENDNQPGPSPKKVPLHLAYIAADVNEATLIDAGKYSVTAFARNKVQNFFTPQCQVEINAYDGPDMDVALSYTVSDLAPEETKKLGVKYVYALTATCIIVTKNPLQNNGDIGKLLEDVTEDVIKAVGWRKEDALAQAKKTQEQMGNGGGGGSSGNGGGGSGGKLKNGKSVGANKGGKSKSKSDPSV